MKENILFKVLLLHLVVIIIKVNGLITYKKDNEDISSNPSSISLMKRYMSSIIYLISDYSGDTDLLSFIQPINNYDVSVTPNMKYHYNISKNTSYYLTWESSDKCKPIYEDNKQVAITHINDIISHRCYSEGDDLLDVEELYNQIELPELLLVQFNDIYELRVYIYIYIINYNLN